MMLIPPLWRLARHLVQALFSVLLRSPERAPAAQFAEAATGPRVVPPTLTPGRPFLPNPVTMNAPDHELLHSSPGLLIDNHAEPVRDREANSDAASQEPASAAPEPDEEYLIVAGGSTMGLHAALESLLFVADKPVSPEQLARSLRLPVEVVEAGLRSLADELVHARRGIRLQFQQEKVRLVTRPDAAAAIEEFLNLDLTARLSGPALETLAVIAYRQPVTRAQIEAVRGVDCGGVLRTLVQRGLVEEVGRLEAVGRPFVYGITEQFMHHFGLMNLSELPPLEAGERDLLASVEGATLDSAQNAG